MWDHRGVLGSGRRGSSVGWMRRGANSPIQLQPDERSPPGLSDPPHHADRTQQHQFWDQQHDRKHRRDPIQEFIASTKGIQLIVTVNIVTASQQVVTVSLSRRWPRPCWLSRVMWPMNHVTMNIWKSLKPSSDYLSRWKKPKSIASCFDFRLITESWKKTPRSSFSLEKMSRLWLSPQKSEPDCDVAAARRKAWLPGKMFQCLG